MSENLLPCPFCGRTAHLSGCDTEHSGTLYGVYCPECGGMTAYDGFASEAEALAAWNRRPTSAPVDAYPAHADDWLRLDLMRDVPTERLRVIAVNEREGQATAEYKFIGEVLITQNDSEEDDEPASVCIIKCKKCGWHMFGDGWWEHPASTNFTEAEQIPRYCAHCGRKLGDEAEPEREGAER